MKPDWDRLMDEFGPPDSSGTTTAGATRRLVADVDCTTPAGKVLCDSAGVRGYPTLKYGDPSDLQDYKGGRDYDALRKFVLEELKPACGPSDLDLCEPDKRAEVETFLAMSPADLDAAIAAREAEQGTMEAEFKTLAEALQKQYKEANEAKDRKLEEIKNGGLGLMKAVRAAAAAKTKTDKEEL
jgi:hypothetical protein